MSRSQKRAVSHPVQGRGKKTKSAPIASDSFSANLVETVACIVFTSLHHIVAFDRGLICYLDASGKPVLLTSFPRQVERDSADLAPQDLNNPHYWADILDVPSPTPYLRGLSAQGTRSVLHVPLASDGALAGTLVLQAHAPHMFDEYVDLIREVATPLAPLIVESRALGDARQRLLELSAIYECTQQLQRLHTPEDLALEIIRVLERTLHYEYPAVFLIEHETGYLIPFALGQSEQGASNPDNLGTTDGRRDLKLGQGITGWVAQTGESVRVDDVAGDARYVAAHPDVRSELCVPLKIGAQVIGVVNVESARPAAYTDSDQRMLETIATQMAIAIQDARLFDQVRQGREQLRALSKQLLQAHETERRNIARELHDEIGQSVTAVQMCLFSLGRFLSTGDAMRLMQDGVSTTERVLRQVRDLSLNLRPSVLDDFGLAAAIRWYAERQVQRTGLAIHLDLAALEDTIDRLPVEVETVCFRATQEAVTNVIRHARAHSVRIQVRQIGSALNLSIQDDGIGFDVSAALARGTAGASMGLMGLRERVLLVGGKVDIHSSPGQETEIQISVPLTAEMPFLERRAHRRSSP